jgi:hypothetical protein
MYFSARDGNPWRRQRQDGKADRAHAHADRHVAHETAIVDDVCIPDRRDRDGNRRTRRPLPSVTEMIRIPSGRTKNVSVWTVGPPRPPARPAHHAGKRSDFVVTDHDPVALLDDRAVAGSTITRRPSGSTCSLRDFCTSSKRGCADYWVQADLS